MLKLTLSKSERPGYQPLDNFIIRSRPFSAFAQVIFHSPIHIHLIGSDRHWENKETSVLSPIPTLRTAQLLRLPLPTPSSLALPLESPSLGEFSPTGDTGDGQGKAPSYPPPPIAHEWRRPLPQPPHPQRGPGLGRACQG